MGLLRGMARTAAVVGTANAVSRHQQQKWAAQDQQAYEAQAAAAPQASAGTAGTDTVTQLQELAKLKDQGILTEEEFAAQKAKLLG